MTRFSPSFEVKAARDGTVEGYGSVFDVVDLVGDSVQAGAFADSIAEHKAAGTRPAMLFAHDQARPVGVWTDFSEDTKGLHVRGKVSDTRDGREAYTLAKDGAVALSIGYDVKASRPGDGPFRVLERVGLHEVSFVGLPANPHARLTSVKSLDGLPMGEFCKHLSTALGISRRDAERLARSGYAAFRDGNAELDDLAEALRHRYRTD